MKIDKHFIVYHSVVGKVEANLQDAADAGRHCGPKQDLRAFVEGIILFRKCPDKSGQEVMSGVNLAL